MTERCFYPNMGFVESVMGFLPRAGRAIVMPVFKGAWDRDDAAFSIRRSSPDSSASYRDLTIQWIKDLRRTIDYLATRKDINIDRIGYYGFSWGGERAALALAIEPRIKAAVL